VKEALWIFRKEATKLAYYGLRPKVHSSQDEVGVEEIPIFLQQRIVSVAKPNAMLGRELPHCGYNVGGARFAVAPAIPRQRSRVTKEGASCLQIMQQVPFNGTDKENVGIKLDEPMVMLQDLKMEHLVGVPSRTLNV